MVVFFQENSDVKQEMSAVRQILYLLLLPILPALAVLSLHPQPPAWNPMALGEGEVDLSIVRDWTDSILWVDARDVTAYEQGHIPGAIHLYEGNFDEQIHVLLDAWHPDMRVVVYCDSRECGASSSLANRLREEFQMDRVYVLKGGWSTWKEAKP
jgi:rhodanese-related sulfurtransferase